MLHMIMQEIGNTLFLLCLSAATQIFLLFAVLISPCYSQRAFLCLISLFTVFLIAVFMLCPPFAYISYSIFFLFHPLLPPSVWCLNSVSLFPLFFYPPQNFSRIPSLLSPSASSAVLNFYLDSRWGLHADRLVVSKEQRCARSVPGLSLLQAADRALTSCHLTADLLVGDVAITQGRHYWACSVEPGSYLVKASSATKENYMKRLSRISF